MNSAKPPSARIGRSRPSSGRSNQVAVFPDGFDKHKWLNEYRQIKKDLNIEDRDRYRPLLRLKKEPEIMDFIEEVERLDKKNEIGVMRERGQITNFIQKAKQDVDCARSMIYQSKSEPEYLDRIQSKCQMVEQNLKNFKLKSRATYNQLAEQEQTLMAELSAFEDKFESWASEIDTTKKARPPRPAGMKAIGPPNLRKSERISTSTNRLYSAQSQTRQTEKENTDSNLTEIFANQQRDIKRQLDDIEIELVQNGGNNCGWDAPDHKDFLRIRTKYANKLATVAFINEMARTVPTADEVAVREHCAAYDKYLRLQQEKKDLIQKYKQAKESEKVAKMTKVNQDKGFTSRLNSDLNLNQRQKSVGVRAGSLGVKERAAVKQEVAEWKRKKLDREREIDTQRLAENEAQKDRLKKKLERERQLKREMVEEYKYQKEMDKQRERALEMQQKTKISQVSKSQQDRIREREQAMWQKKHMMIIQKEDKKLERAAKMENAKYKLSNKYQVESRLHAETKAMAEKKRDKFDASKETGKDAHTMGGKLPMQQMRMQPSWRQGV